MASTATSDPNKRKNDEVAPRRPQWWLLVVGIIIGALFILIIQQNVPVTTQRSDSAISEDVYLTATAIIAGATQTANAFISPVTMSDPLAGTDSPFAQATQTAAAVQSGS